MTHSTRSAAGSAGFAAVIVLLMCAPGARPAARDYAPAGARSWPSITHQTKPWTRWWWQGSAVEPASLTAQLEALKAAGIGGVEITPIYGVRGTEDRFIPYLSDAWMKMLDYTLREARRLDLGVDMATGTGWPFGGPWVGDSMSARTIAHKTWILSAGERLTRAREAPPDTARSCARQSDSRRQRGRAGGPAARRCTAAAGDPIGCARDPDRGSRRPGIGQPESPGAGARAGEVSARSAVERPDGVQRLG